MVVNMSLKQTLSEIIALSFQKEGIDPKYGEVVLSQRQDLGQFQCNGALAAAKIAKKNPREIAQNIINDLLERDEFKELTIAGPGFINITLKDKFLADFIDKNVNTDRVGCQLTPEPKNILIDYGGPNVAKPMHVGHLRASIIGESLKRVFKFFGHNIQGDIHLGDWGTQMGMLICEMKKEQPDLPYFIDNYDGEYPSHSPVSIDDLEKMYPRASKRCKEDEEEKKKALEATAKLQSGHSGYRALWSHFVKISIDEMKKDFSALGVNFELWLGESDSHDAIKPMVEKLKNQGAQLSDGAWIIPFEKEEGKKEIPPLILLKSDGSSLYSTTDMATIDQRINDLDIGWIIYVVDQRQALHFKQVFKAVKQTGISLDTQLDHVGFGTVNGPDGKPFKTREGGVMKLKDLIAMMKVEALKRMEELGVSDEISENEKQDIASKVGLAALKYADLMNHRLSNYVFDIQKFTKFEGKTGPYLLYAAVRINSILRKVEQNNLKAGSLLPPTDNERELMLELCKLPEVLNDTKKEFSLNYLCDHAYNLSQTFNRFYRKCHILNESNPELQASWISLSQMTVNQLSVILDLLGIEIPHRM